MIVRGFHPTQTVFCGHSRTQRVIWCSKNITIEPKWTFQIINQYLRSSKPKFRQWTTKRTKSTAKNLLRNLISSIKRSWRSVLRSESKLIKYLKRNPNNIQRPKGSHPSHRCKCCRDLRVPQRSSKLWVLFRQRSNKDQPAQLGKQLQIWPPQLVSNINQQLRQISHK